jgi:hypothetical protein
LVVLVALRNRVGLLVIGWTLVAVQAADGLVGLGYHQTSKGVGPLIVAAATAAVLMLWSRRRPER